MTLRPDDCTLTKGEFAKVRAEAERALREAGAMGVFPTPIDDILNVAQVVEVKEDVLNPSFIDKMRATAGGFLKSAVGKVIGLFDAVAGLIFLDQSLYLPKKRFVTFHEAAHGFLPWQRGMYKIVEDCEMALEPETAELFDRQANVFAAEVLFQLDTFATMAANEKFSIWTPIKLAKDFQASLYASIRQYVSKSHRRCAVLVLNKPELIEGDGFRATLRRAIQSPAFTEVFGQHTWRTLFTPGDEFGKLVPLGSRKASGKRGMYLTDANGDRHECVVEAFTQTHQVFILIHCVKTLGPPGLLF
jgi:Zn-dependent peptidase ImmA (M78 family)